MVGAVEKEREFVMLPWQVPRMYWLCRRLAAKLVPAVPETRSFARINEWQGHVATEELVRRLPIGIWWSVPMKGIR